jgi:hypothetical protein
MRYGTTQDAVRFDIATRLVIRKDRNRIGHFASLTVDTEIM